MSDHSFGFDYSSTTSQSFQGQLSSQYTSWLTNYLQNNSDVIAYLAHTVNGLDVQDALAFGQQVAEGNFSLAGLFSAAQSKTGPVDGNNITDPTPTLTIGDVTIDLTAILSGTTTETWTQVQTNNSGKKASTETTYHTREFYGTAGEPAGYEANWWVENSPPEANPIVIDDALETLSVYEDHEITNTAPDLLTIDLRDGASDPDGQDTLNVVGSVSLSGSSIDLTEGTTWWVDGNTLYIDQNSRELDELLNGQTETLTFSYKLTDGEYEVDTSATITITGTLDEYKASDAGEVGPVTYYRSDSSSGSGNINGQSLSIDTESLPDGFVFTGGTLTATQSGLTGNQQGGLSDAGNEDWTSGAIGLGKQGNSFVNSETVDLASGALDDGQVDYNVQFNTTDGGDYITVTLNYDYDYWYQA
jgi:hypothetical protein